MDLCSPICSLYLFLGSFSSVCLFVQFNILVFALFCIISFYYCPIETSLFPNKRKKEDGLGWARSWGGTGRSKGERSYKRDILCEEKKFNEKKTTKKNNNSKMAATQKKAKGRAEPSHCDRATQCRGSSIFYSCRDHFKFNCSLIFLTENPKENYPALFWGAKVKRPQITYCSLC